jgi:branched-chain amino acid transport system ATP-binding protein
MTTMLEVKDLSVSYGQHRALEKATLRINRGEIAVILGANGAGKSTLLKAVSGICEGRVTGTITMQGREILGSPAHRIVEEGIALVPEGRGVFGDLTVAENLKLGAHANRAREDAEGNLQRVLQLFPKLHERRNQIVRTMSGGEQQMVAIGRAMMSNPALLTLDEPSLGLSPLLCKELFQALKAVRDTGIGILLVEQNAKQSLAIADRGYLIENGHIIHEGRATELRNDPAVQAAYLGGSPSHADRRAPIRVAPPAAPVNAKRVEAASMPAFTAPSGQPRSSGASPADIAAAALAALPAPPSRPVTATATHPARPPQAARSASDASMTAAVVSQPKPPVLAPARREAVDQLLGGLSLNNIIAEASRASRTQVETASPAISAPPRRATQAAPPKVSSPSLAIGGSEDRLKSVMREIEEAAARAQARRHDANRN